MVEVFCTNVNERLIADMLLGKLSARLPEASFHFDLEDCDRILRVECHSDCTAGVVEELNAHGYHCALLS
ncbi:MAG: hypothetical protein MUC87_00930 [Bacteroidia bacterium]|jgi:hypothetical protein|nr:hypothetical protein [Bacteroidia bacterium]